MISRIWWVLIWNNNKTQPILLWKKYNVCKYIYYRCKVGNTPDNSLCVCVGIAISGPKIGYRANGMDNILSSFADSGLDTRQHSHRQHDPRSYGVSHKHQIHLSSVHPLVIYAIPDTPRVHHSVLSTLRGGAQKCRWCMPKNIVITRLWEQSVRTYRGLERVRIHGHARDIFECIFLRHAYLFLA